MCEINNKNRIGEQFISSQVFHRTPDGHVRKITAEEQFKPRILKSFDLVNQELYQHLPATIHTQSVDYHIAEEELGQRTTHVGREGQLETRTRSGKRTEGKSPGQK
jgi:hypothetical protein